MFRDTASTIMRHSAWIWETCKAIRFVLLGPWHPSASARMRLPRRDARLELALGGDCAEDCLVMNMGFAVMGVRVVVGVSRGSV